MPLQEALEYGHGLRRRFFLRHVAKVRQPGQGAVAE